jgi:hypothetical protein
MASPSTVSSKAATCDITLYRKYLSWRKSLAAMTMRNLTLMSSNVYTVAMSFGLTCGFQRNRIYQRIAEPQPYELTTSRRVRTFVCLKK